MAVSLVPGGGAAPGDGGPARLIKKPEAGDFIDLPAGKAAADVFVTFGEGQGQLAFWVEGVTNSSLRGPVNCLPVVPAEAYAVRGLPEGAFPLHAALWEAAPGAGDAKPQTAADLDGARFVVAARAAVDFTVRRFEDFAAGYDWQPVERWHRLPAGLEISLDLGTGAGSGSRRARIPQPWNWDARVQDDPAPRRVPVEADTTFGELLLRLGFSRETHEAVWQQPDGSHARPMDAGWTARQADLFRYRGQISIRQKP